VVFEWSEMPVWGQPPSAVQRSEAPQSYPVQPAAEPQ